MEQKATVIALEGNLAKIMVQRKTACGHDCSKCGGCGVGSNGPLIAYAQNKANAAVGDVVEVSSKDGNVAKKAFIVYMLPLVVMVAAYIIAAACGLPDSYCILTAGAGLILSVAALMLYDRKVVKHEALPVISRIFREG